MRTFVFTVHTNRNKRLRFTWFGVARHGPRKNPHRECTANIPWYYFRGYLADILKLHNFFDASEEAYEVVAFFRIVDNSQVLCVLVSESGTAQTLVSSPS